MQKEELREKELPKQQQDIPGQESVMRPEPETIREDYRGSGKLEGKVAFITGGDSGIGRAVAVHFAREGAKVAIIYLTEDDDAQTTKAMVEQEGRECLVISGDIKDRTFCKQSVEEVYNKFGAINILVNNAAEQHPHDDFSTLDLDVMESTFKTNIFAMFYITKAAVKYLQAGDSIINTASIVAYQGRAALIDYGSTKGAIVSFTRSLNMALAKQDIRVNAVAPGPIWTPLIPSTFDEEHVARFGKSTQMGRPGQPSEVGPAYVFLASKDASYISGQVIHVNGGEAVES